MTRHWLGRLPVPRFLRAERGSAVVEFALVVPILFLMVWAILSFSRAYQRLNALTSSLREGARIGSAMVDPTLGAGQIRATVHNFSTAFGYQVDTSLVVVNASSGFDVRVSVTNYPLFAGLDFVGGLSSITVNREAIFRWERAP